MTVVGVREGRIQASSHRRRSDALCSLELLSHPGSHPRRAQCAWLDRLPASEKRVAAHEEESVGRFAKKKQLRLATRFRGQQLATSLAVVSAVAGLAGLTSTANRVASGTCSRSSSRRFAANWLAKILMPVTLPPDRARLGIRPSVAGSSPATKTIATVSPSI